MLFYPQFYFFKELIASPNWRARTLSEHFWAGIDKYKANFVQDIAASAAVFVPVGLLNFRFVPLIWRTPMLAMFSIAFPIIVSSQRGASVSDGT